MPGARNSEVVIPTHGRTMLLQILFLQANGQASGGRRQRVEATNPLPSC